MNISKSEKQESEYRFPYHYLDFIEGFRLVEYLDYINIVKKLLGDFSGKKVLDAGCGDGRFCFEIKDADIMGVDYSKRAVNFARAFNPDVKFYVNDLVSFKLNKKFDFIVSIETLEHIEPDKLRKVFENFHKMLIADGKLIITVPSKNVKTGSKHYQHFSLRDFEEYNDLFDIEKIIGHGKFDYFHRKLFNFMLMKCYILDILNIKYKKFLRGFYHKNIGKCSVGKAKRLIIVMRKK